MSHANFLRSLPCQFHDVAPFTDNDCSGDKFGSLTLRRGGEEKKNIFNTFDTFDEGCDSTRRYVNQIHILNCNYRIQTDVIVAIFVVFAVIVAYCGKLQ